MLERLGRRARCLAVAGLLVAAWACSSPSADTATHSADSSGDDLSFSLIDTAGLGKDSAASGGDSSDSAASTDGADGADNGPDSQDSGASDASSDTGGIFCGSPGCDCASGGDCDNGFCIEVGGKNQCAALCVTGCPAGFQCTQTTGASGDVVSLCTPQFSRLCEPCQADADCSGALGGQDNRCVARMAKDGSLVGQFCTAPCGSGDSCPSGYGCEETQSVGGAKSKQCVRLDLACPCDERAKKLSLATVCSSANAAGACKGSRSCSAAGLSACDAPSAQTETCNTLDDNCNGQTDEGGADLCQDGAACTYDNCIAGECQHPPKTGACDDGSACSSADLCSDGLCKGQALSCDDGNPCTADSCDPKSGCVALPSAASCSDGDACTQGDSCAQGACAPGPALSCDDGNPCTGDSCDSQKGCQIKANSEPCDDGSACSSGDTCKGGACQGSGQVSCDDANGCTADSCDPQKGCVHAAGSAACNDGDACTSGETCIAGACKGGSPLPCSDGNPCTDDACDPQKGCSFAPNSAPCDDASGCTSGDVCQNGVCKSGKGCGANAVCAPAAGGGVACACASGYSGDGQNCALVCPPGCVSCSNPTTCTQCEPGKLLQNGQCSSCTPKSCGSACGQVPDGCGKVVECGPCSSADLAAGNGFTCALQKNGTVRCWGANSLGQLGDGSYLDRWQASWVNGGPALVQGIANAVQIAAGDAHACALLGDGSVQCWGSHSNGQLGDGTAASPAGRNTPVKVSGISTAVHVSAGRLHTCAVLADGTARCWGYNATGQLGDGTTAQRIAPAAVQGLTGAKMIGAGYDFSCALGEGDAVKCWGKNTYGQLGDNTTLDHLTPGAVVNIASGKALHVAALGQFACAILKDGGAMCWGLSANGQTGNGSVAPAKVPSPVANLKDVKSLAGGSTHTCAALGTGAVYCWGTNSYGQVGDGTTVNRLLPTLVSGVSGADDVAAGQAHSCALLADATVSCWGQNHLGQLGNETSVGSTTPVAAAHLPCGGGGTSKTCGGCAPTNCQAQKQISGTLADGCGGSLLCGLEAPKIATGNGFTCALPGDGSARCWGVNDKGQLGDGGTRTRYQPTSVDGAALAVIGVSGAVALSAGDSHACALLGSGKIRCWGSHANGQLGTGKAADSVPYSESQEVAGISDAIAVSAGRLHTCAVLGDGSARCWGYNASGQLGDGTSVQRVAPAAVVGLSGLLAVRAGYNFSCGLTQTGLVKCWGDSGNGQLGSGTTSSLLPRNVPGVSGAVELGVSALGQHACAVNSDGSAQCWGLNSYGQLGDGTTTYRPLAVGVLGLKAATWLQAGANHTCARMGDGTVKCFGYNAYGQLGDGTTTNRSLATAVAGITSAVQVAGGSTHSCAALKSGELQCWGHNNAGQLGVETSLNGSSPAAVANFPCGGGGTSVVCGCKPTTCQALGLSSGSAADGCGGTLLCGTAAAGVAGGNGFGCAIAADASVKCWGSNAKGQLGDGTTANSPKPVVVKGLSGASHVAAGDSHACAVVASGAVWCWGSNSNGQLGLGSPVDSIPHSAAPVAGLSGAVKVSAGRLHTCAVLADGSARCWGYNASGQLGDGSVLTRLAPASVAELTGLIDIAAGYSSSCALKQTGLVKCWGDNASGQLGNGNTASLWPMNVAGLSEIVGLSSGSQAQHACAVKANGSARCWGSNGYGQLGDNSIVTRNLPVAVASLSGANSISTGNGHTCATSSDGSAKCWGYNAYGQLGDGTTTQRLMPVGVTGLAGASRAAAQGSASCFGLAGGGVRCSGYNITGGLGDGTTANKSTVVSTLGLP